MSKKFENGFHYPVEMKKLFDAVNDAENARVSEEDLRVARELIEEGLNRAKTRRFEGFGKSFGKSKLPKGSNKSKKPVASDTAGPKIQFEYEPIRIRKSAPGSFAVKTLSFIFPKKTYDNVFAQAIADMREEYFEAILNDQSNKARWIVFRDNTGLAVTVLAYFLSTAGKKLKKIWTMT